MASEKEACAAMYGLGVVKDDTIMYNRDQFFEKLKGLGINISVGNHAGTSEFYLLINGHRISTDKYGAFGYYCGGAYANCCRTDRQFWNVQEFEESVKCAISFLDKVIAENKKTVDYHSMRSFLLSKYTEGPKVTSEAVKRVLRILKDDYQNLVRFHIDQLKVSGEDIENTI